MVEWEAYYNLIPSEDIKQDYRMAQLCQLLATIHKGKNQPKFKLNDFMLDFEPKEKKKQTQNDMRNILMGMAKRSRKKK